MQWNFILSKSVSSSSRNSYKILDFQLWIFLKSNIFSFSINFGHFNLFNMTLNCCCFSLIWCFIKQQSDIWEKRTSKYGSNTAKKTLWYYIDESVDLQNANRNRKCHWKNFRIAIVKVFNRFDSMTLCQFAFHAYKLAFAKFARMHHVFFHFCSIFTAFLIPQRSFIVVFRVDVPFLSVFLGMLKLALPLEGNTLSKKKKV